MQMEKSMVNGHRNGELDLNEYFTTITIESESPSSFVTPCKLLPPSSPPQSSSPPSGGGGLKYIEHQVSKFDTLAGVAIKYGVEVADIKKMNGLVTDQQMFALKTLHIPPGRHPPSPVMNNGVGDKRPSSSERTPLGRRHSDFFDSFQSLKSSSQWEVSPTMSASQGCYGLKQPQKEKVLRGGFEMSMYSKEGSHYLEHGTSTKSGTPSNLPLSLHRKCKSVANGFYSDSGNLGTQEAKDNNWGGRWIEKFVRRRPKSEIDLESGAQDTLLKEENNVGVFSALANKGLGLRPKSGNRNVSGNDAEGGFLGVPGEPLLADSNGVRKSSSTPSFLESENGTSASSSSSSIWSMSTWNLKPDFQALSTAAITKPIFDGLPLPIPGRKSKTALD